MLWRSPHKPEVPHCHRLAQRRHQCGATCLGKWSTLRLLLLRVVLVVALELELELVLVLELELVLVLVLVLVQAQTKVLAQPLVQQWVTLQRQL